MLLRLFIIMLLLCAQTAYADDTLKKFADFQRLHVEKSIEAIDLAMLDASDFLERNPDKNELILHDTLSKYVKRTPGLRAIIVMDKNGRLKIDSFTYPARSLDLKDREYVKQSLSAKDRTLYIGQPVIGRSSGAAFIPFSRPLLDTDGNPTGVIASILSPGFLINQENVCPQCLVGVFQHGHTLATYPSNTTYPSEYLTQIEKSDHNSLIEFTIQNQAFTAWVMKLDKYQVDITLTKMNTQKP